METQAASLLGPHGGKSVGIAADVCREEDIDVEVSRIATIFDGVDIHISNACTGTLRDDHGYPRREVEPLLGASRHGGSTDLPPRT